MDTKWPMTPPLGSQPDFSPSTCSGRSLSPFRRSPSAHCCRPASTHDTLASSSPADGDSVEQAPTEIELTYGDDMLNLPPVVRLNIPAGN